jgi:hypothetical protein
MRVFHAAQFLQVSVALEPLVRSQLVDQVVTLPLPVI